MPDTPANLAAVSVTSTAVTLDWDDVSGADHYEVEWSTDQSSWNSAGSPTESSFTVDGLSPNSFYYFRVRACDAIECGDNAETSAGTLPSPPGSPSATTVDDEKIDLDWDDSSGVGAYRIEFSTDGETWQELSGGHPQSDYQATGLSANTEYFFRFQAVGDFGNSEFSEPVSATTAPAVPTGLAVVDSSTGSVSLEWDAVDGAESYGVQKSTDSNSWEDDSSYESTSATPGGLISNTPYFWRVRSQNSNGNSRYSDPVSGGTGPTAPDNFSATPGGEKAIDLDWDDVPEAQGYWLDFSEDEQQSWTNLDSFLGSSNYRHEFLTPGVTYYYRLRAVGSFGYSDFTFANATAEGIPPVEAIEASVTAASPSISSGPVVLTAPAVSVAVAGVDLPAAGDGTILASMAVIQLGVSIVTPWLVRGLHPGIATITVATGDGAIQPGTSTIAVPVASVVVAGLSAAATASSGTDVLVPVADVNVVVPLQDVTIGMVALEPGVVSVTATVMDATLTTILVVDPIEVPALAQAPGIYPAGAAPVVVPIAAVGIAGLAPVAVAGALTISADPAAVTVAGMPPGVSAALAVPAGVCQVQTSVIGPGPAIALAAGVTTMAVASVPPALGAGPVSVTPGLAASAVAVKASHAAPSGEVGLAAAVSTVLTAVDPPNFTFGQVAVEISSAPVAVVGIDPGRGFGPPAAGSLVSVHNPAVLSSGNVTIPVPVVADPILLATPGLVKTPTARLYPGGTIMVPIGASLTGLKVKGSGP